MKILLIRHGLTEWNHQHRLQGRDDVPLCDEGRAQAKALGRALSFYPFSKAGLIVVSSPLARATETARLSTEDLPFSPLYFTDSSLLERDFGEASGMILSRAEKLYPGRTFPGIEPADQAADRIEEGFFRLITTLRNRSFKGQPQSGPLPDLAIVSHGEILHRLLFRLTPDRITAPSCATTILKNASVTTLDLSEDKVAYEYFNLAASELTQALCSGRKDSAMPEIILASASPRRKELLSLITPTFSVEASNAEETTPIPKDLPAQKLPEFLATLKAKDIASRHHNELVIGSDTTVLAPKEDASKELVILGKPKDEEDAARMLSLLSGRKHFVTTGVCLCYQGKTRSFSETAEVEFYPLSENEIQSYITGKEPMDKAGAYAIQGQGSLFVKKIDGDYFTIVGLPVARLSREIKAILAEN